MIKYTKLLFRNGTLSKIQLELFYIKHKWQTFQFILSRYLSICFIHCLNIKALALLSTEMSLVERR